MKWSIISDKGAQEAKYIKDPRLKEVGRLHRDDRVIEANKLMQEILDSYPILFKPLRSGRILV